MTDTNVTTEVAFETIPDVIGYRFLWDGRVQSCWEGSGPGSHLTDRWHDIKPTKPSNRKYYSICIKRNGKRFKAPVHTLMCEAWWGKKPLEPPGLECCHKDDVSTNNRPDNLCWGTRKENIRHRRLNGIQPLGDQCYQAKFSREDIRSIRRRYASRKFTLQQLASEYGVPFQTISRIVNYQNYKEVLPPFDRWTLRDAIRYVDGKLMGRPRNQWMEPADRRVYRRRMILKYLDRVDANRHGLAVA